MSIYDNLNGGQLQALATWAADSSATRKAWRKLAVNPAKLETQLQQYLTAGGQLGADEVRFCLGWAELAWERFANKGKPWGTKPPSLKDSSLRTAILKAIPLGGGG